jgi:hypothetical protein
VIAENPELAMEGPEPVEEAVPLVGAIGEAALPGEAEVALMLAKEEADVFPAGEAPMKEVV